MKRKYRSRIAKVIHEDVEDMYIIGAISNERMNEWDEMCITKAFREGVREAREKRLEREKMAEITSAVEGQRSAALGKRQREAGVLPWSAAASGRSKNVAISTPQ